MKLISRQTQFIVRDENIQSTYSLDSKYVIYSGLGHIVIDSDLLEKENPDLIEQIKEDFEDNYFYRLSFIEDPNINNNEIRCYLTQDLNFFKVKKLSKENKYCFLGREFNIVELKQFSTSKNFNEVPQYECTITSVIIDNKTGEITEGTIWKKVKYGNIERFLPKDLSQYTSVITSYRKKLYFGRSK
jgi:hypothetical protein